MAIGKSVKRVDAVAKVTGRARYTDDFFIPGMLVAKYLRSTIAHGRVKKIDSSKAERLPGVEAVFTYADVPRTQFASAGHPYSLDPAHKDVEDRLLLTQDVRYWGDEIAIVVAENNLVLQEALKLIQVDYEAYQPLVSTQDALAQGAREIHAGSKNVIGESQYTVGAEIDDALAGADVVLESEYRTQMCQHCHIENHIAYAYMDDLEHIVVVSSTQIPHIARRIVGEALGLPWGRIRIVKPYIGGGFGAKQDVILEPMVAFLTLKLGGRPIKIDLSREECMIATRTRHPFEVKVRAGANKDGTLVALEMDALSNTGAYASHGHSVAGAAGAKSRSLYPRAAMHYHARTVYTNIPAAGAMRAYGAPQLMFAVDCMIEEAARKIGMDPVEFRIKNIVRQGDADPLTGARFESCGLIECLQRGKELIGWDESARPGPRVKPVQCAVVSAWPVSAMPPGPIRCAWRLPVPVSFSTRMPPFIFRWVRPRLDRAWIPLWPRWRPRPLVLPLMMCTWCPPRIRTWRRLIQVRMPHARLMWPAMPYFGRPEN
jgi:xanthine dehydrogenase molybdenum-binding subunit